jgi:hypothetical protein
LPVRLLAIPGLPDEKEYDAMGCNSNGRARHPGKLLCFQQREQETGRFMQLACLSVIANPQGEAIHARTLDCFTLRVRNDGRDHLNCIHAMSVSACATC